MKPSAFPTLSQDQPELLRETAKYIRYLPSIHLFQCCQCSYAIAADELADHLVKHLRGGSPNAQDDAIRAQGIWLRLHPDVRSMAEFDAAFGQPNQSTEALTCGDDSYADTRRACLIAFLAPDGESRHFPVFADGIQCMYCMRIFDSVADFKLHRPSIVGHESEFMYRYVEYLQIFPSIPSRKSYNIAVPPRPRDVGGDRFHLPSSQDVVVQSTIRPCTHYRVFAFDDTKPSALEHWDMAQALCQAMSFLERRHGQNVRVCIFVDAEHLLNLLAAALKGFLGPEMVVSQLDRRTATYEFHRSLARVLLVLLGSNVNYAFRSEKITSVIVVSSRSITLRTFQEHVQWAGDGLHRSSAVLLSGTTTLNSTADRELRCFLAAKHCRRHALQTQLDGKGAGRLCTSYWAEGLFEPCDLCERHGTSENEMSRVGYLPGVWSLRQHSGQSQLGSSSDMSSSSSAALIPAANGHRGQGKRVGTLSRPALRHQVRRRTDPPRKAFLEAAAKLVRPVRAKAKPRSGGK